MLGNPWNFKRAVSLTEPQFRFSFTNAVSVPEAKELYAKYAIPAPGRPLFQAATAAFNPNSATKVNVANATRGPLLLISGMKDNTVPPVIVRSTLKMYRQSPAVTDFQEFAGRGHSLTIDSGWQEIAEYSLDWLQSQQLHERTSTSLSTSSHSAEVSDDRSLTQAVRARRGDTSEI